MALPVQSPSYPHNPFHLLPKSPLHHLPRKPTFLAKSQSPSEPPNPIVKGAEPTAATIEPSSVPVAPRKPAPSGLGFGPSVAANSASSRKRKKDQKNSRGGDRPSPVVRRPPSEKPMFVFGHGGGSESEELRRSEGVFFLGWLGLGSAILIEGVVLSASGFLPEELDNFFTNYLYPTFTPAVILFFGGAVAFGVLKYQQNEKLRKK